MFLCVSLKLDNHKEKAKLKKILKLLLSPILAVVWMIGWVLRFFGERKEEEQDWSSSNTCSSQAASTPWSLYKFGRTCFRRLDEKVEG